MHVAMLLSGARGGNLNLGSVAYVAAPGLLCKRPMVFGGDGGDAGMQGDLKTSFVGWDCVSAASPFG